jgi:hypothetical protein
MNTPMSRRLLSLLLALVAVPLCVAPPALAKHHKKKAGPKITSVSPMHPKVGDNVTVRGRGFSPKAGRNTVIFRSSSGKSVFVKPFQATRTRLVLKLPTSLERAMSTRGGSTVATRFKLRVLARKFGKFTAAAGSPLIDPAPKPAPPAPKKNSSGGTGGGSNDLGGGSTAVAPPPDCDNDGTPDSTDTDDDNDLVPDTLEATLGTDRCKVDTDGDGVEDGFEYRSAVDLNDDEYENPQTSLPYPGKRPYPNPLDPSDGTTDYDGDSLTSLEEQRLWYYTLTLGATKDLNALTYSAGEQYSMSTRDGSGHRVPTLAALNYSKQLSFLGWAQANGYRQVDLSDGPPWYDQTQTNSYGILDFNRNGVESTTPQAGYRWAETLYYDFRRDGWLSDDERDEDADGLTNFDETHGPMGAPDWWTSCYSDEAAFKIAYAGTDPTDPDTDGDGVRDGADDQDHDDVPNVMEVSRNIASGTDDRKSGDCTKADGLPTPPATNHAGTYGRVNPFNPCLPASWSRTCPMYTGFGAAFAPFDDSPNWYSLN